MPALLRVGGYRFFFYSLENQKPLNIHAAHAGQYAKYWLAPVALASNRGFRSHELTTIRQLVEQHRDFFLEKWSGISIHWDAIDEDISVASLLQPERFMSLCRAPSSVRASRVARQPCPPVNHPSVANPGEGRPFDDFRKSRSTRATGESRRG